jgi:hypothetical protein
VHRNLDKHQQRTSRTAFVRDVRHHHTEASRRTSKSATRRNWHDVRLSPDMQKHSARGAALQLAMAD